MKITYSIAIILSCTLAQLVSASDPGATRNGLAPFKSEDITESYVHKRTINKRYLATALRRRQANNSYFSQQPPAEPATQVDTILNSIQDSIRLALVSVSEGNGDNQGEEESHDSEDHLERKQGKEVIKLVEKLVKAINKLLKVVGLEEDALNIDGIIESTEKGTLAPPASENDGQLEARGLGALFNSPASLDRDLTAAKDPENDNGDDGSTEGDDQHKARKKQHASPAQPNPVSVPAAPAAPGAVPPAGTPKVSDSDGGTDGDDEHHQHHPNPAKKRSSDPDPKEIKEAVNEVNNILEELSGASQALEDGNGSGISQLTAQVQQLETAISTKPVSKVAL